MKKNHKKCLKILIFFMTLVPILLMSKNYNAVAVTINFENSPIGWASFNALGQNGTTGGIGGKIVVVTNQEDLAKYASLPEKYIIYIANDIDISPKGYTIQVKSNKSILGLNKGVKIRYGGFELKGTESDRVKNVIIRNLNITETYVEGDWDGKTQPWDGITMEQSHHVLIDHCSISKHADGGVDIVKNSNYVTVSWCEFTNNNKTMGIGTSGVDTDQTKVTLHHNWFNEVNQRNPRVNNGLVHAYNNYYTNVGEQGGYISSVEKNGQLNFEYNYAENCRKSLLLGDNTANVYESNNVWNNCGIPSTSGTVFNPSKYYIYTPDKVSDIPQIVSSGAGVNKIVINNSDSENNIKDTIIVAKDGSGNFKSVQEAINSIPTDNKERKTIYIKNGIYKEKVRINSDFVALIGENKDKVIITYDDHVNTNNSDEYNAETPTVIINGNNFYADNLTFENTAGQIERANAIKISSDKASFFNCRIIGGQDTLFLYKKDKRAYFENCYIEGDVDFIYGAMNAVFEKCEIYSNDGGYVTAPSTEQTQNYGFMFNECNFTGSAKAGSVYLGRPWRPYASTVLKNCILGSHISPKGWDNWGNTENEKTARFMEYNSQGVGWDITKRVKWTKVLDNDTVKPHTSDNYLKGSDNWNYKERISINSGNSDSSYDNKVYKIKNLNSGKYLDVTSIASGVKVIQNTKSTSLTQRWKFIYDGNGYYYIENCNSANMIIDIEKGSTDNCANIQIWGNSKGDHQKFKVLSNGDGTYRIVTKITDDSKALDVLNFSMDDGGSIIQYDYWGGNSQRWILEEVK